METAAAGNINKRGKQMDIAVTEDIRRMEELDDISAAGNTQRREQGD